MKAQDDIWTYPKVADHETKSKSIQNASIIHTIYMLFKLALQFYISPSYSFHHTPQGSRKCCKYLRPSSTPTYLQDSNSQYSKHQPHIRYHSTRATTTRSTTTPCSRQLTRKPVTRHTFFFLHNHSHQEPYYNNFIITTIFFIFFTQPNLKHRSIFFPALLSLCHTNKFFFNSHMNSDYKTQLKMDSINDLIKFTGKFLFVVFDRLMMGFLDL